MRYTLRLLGNFELRVKERRVEKFPTAKAKALLCYLALESSATGRKEFPRRTLASYFWPDIGDTYALQNLRNTLYRLRNAAGNDDRLERLISATRDSVFFDATYLDLDVAEFQSRIVAASSHPHDVLEKCTSCLNLLRQAQSYYQGELLAGFTLSDSPPFEEWLVLHRERQHQLAIDVAAKLLRAAEIEGDSDQSIKAAQRLLDLDFYREDAHRALMRAWVTQGLGVKALDQFKELSHLLERDMGIAPSQETIKLAEQIRHGQIDAQPREQESRNSDEKQPDRGISIPHPTPRSANLQASAIATPDVSEVPMVGFFSGRHAEQVQLTQWIVHDRTQVVSILGLGGIGKTALVAQFLHGLANPTTSPAIGAKIDAVIWRSLINAPTVDEILPPILQYLSEEPLNIVPASIDEQIRLLMGFLRKKRVILVLDNLESILEPAEAGNYRSGYDPFAQLIEWMATRKHQSHHLLTSRERPSGYLRLERDSDMVQALHLTGLDEDAGRRLLALRNLSSTGDDEKALIARYSGNPLALKLVADTVEELFGGDIAQFLADELLVFEDIRTVLDEQFARLSSLECELLLWMAIGREPITISALRRDLLHPPAQHLLIEALRSLQKRSLIERQDSAFVLQNVVTEYLTARIIAQVTQELLDKQLDWMHRHALVKAEAKEYVRQSQERLILEPIASYMRARLGLDGFQAQANRIVVQLQLSDTLDPSFVAGNILNLFRHLNIDITSHDFSQLNIRQANLRGWTLANVNLGRAHITSTLFTESFSTPHALSIHPEEELLAVGTENGEIGLWTLANAQLVQVLEGHTQQVSSVLYSPDGRWLASCSLDDTVRLWDPGANYAVGILQLPKWGGGVLAFSPDSRLLASGGRDGQIYLWDVESGRLVHQIESQVRWVYALAFSPNGQFLAGSGRPKFIHLWDLSHLESASYDEIDQHTTSQNDRKQAIQDRPIITLTTKHAPVPALAFSPDGKLLASGSGGYVTEVWDVSDIRSVNKQPKWTFDGDGSWVCALAISPDSNTIASGTNEGMLYLSSLENGQRIDTLIGHNYFIYALTFDPTSKVLISASEDNTVRLWNSSEGHWQLSGILQSHMPGSNAIAFSPDGAVLAVGDTMGLIHLWRGDPVNAANCHYQALSGHTNCVEAIVFHTNGRWLASAGIDKTIRVWDLQPEGGGGPRCVNLLADWPTRLHAVGFTQDGNYLYGSGQDGKIRIWHIDADGRLQQHRTLQRNSVATVSVDIHPQGDHLLEVTYAGAPQLWRIADEMHLMELEGLRDVTSLAFSPDGRVAGAGSRSGCVAIWAMSPRARGQCLAISPSCDSPIGQIAFDPGSRLIAGACEDGVIRLWKLDDLAVCRQLELHAGTASAVAFRPDGQILASGGSDGMVRLWNHAAGECVAILELPRPYEGMNITGTTGITQAQRTSLKALGAKEEP